MRRKSTEKFMRDAMSFKAPEEVWDKIKDKPIQSVRESKAKGHPKRFGMPRRRALRLARFSYPF